MKNLKRVLSLGLASVMLLGMMVVGASAKDFTDAEDIVHSEAVQVMVALSIINGKEDGSFFAPKDNVTRAEMAKMIAVMMNGGSEANTGVKGTPTFTDIGGHWAEGWIEYCADMKIINGRGDGTFDPNGLVTGTEALKMVLTAMGYDAEAYHLQGASWAAQTLERARQTGPVKLTDELSDVVMTQPATRDTAAQMIWNGLQSFVVTNSPEQNTNNGEVTWGWHASTTTKLLEQRYNAHIHTGIFNGNWNTGHASLKGEIDVAGTDFPYDFPIENIGEEVKVVWKDGPRSTSKDALDSKDTIFGVFNTGATRVVHTQLSKIKDNSDNNGADEILNIDGTKYEAKTNVAYYVNFKQNGTKTSAGKKSVAGSLAQALSVNSGYPVKVTFDEADGKVNKVYVTETYIGLVSAINSTNISIVGNSGVSCNLKIADYDIEEGLEKDDIVTVTPYYDWNPNNTSNDKLNVVVKKAEKVSGELVAGKDDETLTLDNGKDYKVNYKNPKPASKYSLLQDTVSYPADDGDITNSFPFADDDDLIGENFDLYLVNGYVMAAIKTSESANNYSVILEVKGDSDEAGATFGGLQLQVLTADGTKEIITVDKKSDDTQTRNPDTPAKITSADYGVGDIITYTFNNDDEAKVTVEGQLKAAAQVKYDDKAKTVQYTDEGGNVVKRPTSANCVFYAQTKAASLVAGQRKNTATEWKTYNIRDLDDFDETHLYTVVTDGDNKVVAVAMDLQGKPTGASDDTVWGIVSKYVRREEDFWVYNVQANGEEYTIKVETTNKVKVQPLAERNLVTFNPTANNEYDEGDVYKMGVAGSMDTGENWYRGFVKEYSSRDNTLTLWNNAPSGPDVNGVFSYAPNGPATTYAIDKDATIIFVDQDGKTSSGVSSINAYSQMDGSKARANVGYVLDNDDVIQVIFVETSGKRDVEGKETPSAYPELGA